MGIDFGAVILMGVLAKFDLDKQSELQGKVDEKIQRKKDMKVISKAMKERESILKSLSLEITIGEGKTGQASVADLQSGAKQHMIIVAGPRRACKVRTMFGFMKAMSMCTLMISVRVSNHVFFQDALIGANLLKMDFALSNVLVVPYETDNDSADQLSRPSGGFGDRPSYETQPYIARATGDDWDAYIQREIKDAVTQSGESAKKDGIAIVVANNGEIIRRGVGLVPWREMVEQLEETVNPTSKKGILPWMDY